VTGGVHLDLAGAAAWLTLDRPGRGNALVPELLAAFRVRLAEAQAAGIRVLAITGAGRAFSAGGDVAVFAAHAGDAKALRGYAAEIVGELNAAILDLLAFPAPVIAVVNGPVTGGSAGLMLAADMVAMSEAAFLQPYYSEVGFAPDGGWTALLPERIGAAAALKAMYLNEHLSAADCLRLGLVHRVCAPGDLRAAADAWVGDLLDKDAASLAATRANVWNPARRARVAAALEREREGFLSLIARPETLERMRHFLNPATSTTAGGAA
jgi:2-(1,2-epoxy-1,2-dihydrophenyl)acetyl-CoA isomerase